MIEYDLKTKQLTQIESEPLTAKQLLAQSPEVVKSRSLYYLKVFIQNRLDLFAETGGYKDIIEGCSFANSSVEKFRKKGEYCVSIRDAHWLLYEELTSDIEKGKKQLTTEAQFEAEMPILNWPV